ncbi:MAG: DUF2807 domain-containing protein [Chloroflexi bacterium]|nr:DUF2807 domain-containing protein [Chloroflexota bacterium]
MRTLSLTLVAILALTLSACSFYIPMPQTILGSGKLTTKNFEFADFQSVDVGSTFQADVSQSDTFSVSITADDNLFDYIKVDKSGSKLSIRFDYRGGYTRGTLKAKITMPTLEALRISGASTGNVSEFKLSKPATLDASGASTLIGSFVADRIDVHVSGASKANLQGNANAADLKADGASTLNLNDFSLDSASVSLSGASNARISVKSKLDYNLSGASHLTYDGNPTIGRSSSSGASSVAKK